MSSNVCNDCGATLPDRRYLKCADCLRKVGVIPVSEDRAMSILPHRGRPFVDAPCNLEPDEEMVERGRAIFRNIASRHRAGLCVRRIGRDRYCPRPSAEGSMTCARHPLILPDGWED